MFPVILCCSFFNLDMLWLCDPQKSQIVPNMRLFVGFSTQTWGRRWASSLWTSKEESSPTLRSWWCWERTVSCWFGSDRVRTDPQSSNLMLSVGTGKTTFIRMLAGGLKPDGGGEFSSSLLVKDLYCLMFDLPGVFQGKFLSWTSATNLRPSAPSLRWSIQQLK